MTPIHLRNVPPPAETFNHIHFMQTIAFWLKPERYLELGCRAGASLIPISKLSKEVYAVDMNPPKYTIPDNCKVSICTTDQFFENLDPAINFDMVFIDADHSYEQCLQDFLNVKDKVVKNGFVLFHDTYPYSKEFMETKVRGDCYRVPMYIRENLHSEWEVVTLPFNPGLSIAKKTPGEDIWNY